MNDTGPVIGRSRCHRLDGSSRLPIGRIRQLRGRKGRGGGMDARTGRLAAPHSIRAQGGPGAADLGDPVIVERLRRKFRFYDWNPATGEVRWMCAFDTTPEDIDIFAAAVTKELRSG